MADDLVPELNVDAIVSGDALTLSLAEELERLAPFGQGNPPVTLLVPAAHLADPRAMGEGRHVAFSLHAGGARSRCVRFGAGHRLPAAPDEPVDAAVSLEANRWNGAVEPRLVLRHARPSRPAPIDIIGEPTFEAGLHRELVRDLDSPLAGTAADAAQGHSRAGGRRPEAALRGAVPAAVPSAAAHEAAVTAHDVRGIGIAGLLADLVAAGQPVLAVVAHAPHRASTLRDRIGGFAVCSWAALGDDPRLAARYAQVVAVDPPAHAAALALLTGTQTHLAWGAPELRFARRIHQWDFALRDPLTALYRALRDTGEVRGEALEAVLRGGGPQPRSAALAGRLVRVLSELGLVILDREGRALRLAERPARTALDRSAAYRAYHRRLEDGLRFLTSDTIRQAAA
jgi:single-stranded-DNA-specific exonuclease